MSGHCDWVDTRTSGPLRRPEGAQYFGPIRCETVATRPATGGNRVVDGHHGGDTSALTDVGLLQGTEDLSPSLYESTAVVLILRHSPMRAHFDRPLRATRQRRRVCRQAKSQPPVSDWLVNKSDQQ